MSNRIENISEFIDVSLDELANADIKFIKGIKAIFRVVSSGKNIIDGENNNDFNKFKENLKREFKKLASSPKTDENHLREILKNMKLFFDDEESLINYYKNKEELVRKIRNNTDIPLQSELPNAVADIVIDNITNLVTVEEWSKAIHDELTELSRESLEKLVNLHSLCLDINSSLHQRFENMDQKLDITNNHLNNLNGMLIKITDRKHDLSLMPSIFDRIYEDKSDIINEHKSYIEDFQAPLFLDNNEDNSKEKITLQQMYVDPYDADFSDRLAYETINAWYNLGNRTKRIMFVFGDAGVGKSSLCSKIIYDAHYYQNDKKFCIPADKLHICRLRSKISEIEASKINNINDFLGILFDIKKYDFDNDFFILDGFDELCVLIKNKSLINTIINKLKQFRGNCKILITSRNSEEYFDDNILKSSDKIKILNIKWKPYNIDTWCKKYAKSTSSETIKIWCNNFPEKYNKFPKDDERREIFCVPIILYISAKAEIDVEEHNSVGQIYDEAFRKIAHRNYSELQEGMDNFNEDEEEKQRLINWQFTKEVAYQMFLNDTLYISDTRDSKLLENAKNRTVAVLKNRDLLIKIEDIRIPQYLAMFHFARPGKDGEGIEFAHKTVYEYFTAVKLYEDYFAYINSDYPEPDIYESLEKVWTNIIEAFRYNKIPEEIFAYLNNMERPSYNGKTQEDSKNKFDYKKFERHYIEGMKCYILSVLPIGRPVNEYRLMYDWKIEDNKFVGKYYFVTTQIGCAFRNLTWFLSGHGYCNIEGINECTNISELTSVYYSDLNLENWNLNKARFIDRTILYNAKLKNAKLVCGSFVGTGLICAHLEGANLTNVSMSKADLMITNLKNTDLTGADLRGADLTGADLTGAIMTNINLTGAKYCSSSSFKTIFPDGFDPKEHGMIEVDEEGKPILR